jgi:hypothetical protein
VRQLAAAFGVCRFPVINLLMFKNRISAGYGKLQTPIAKYNRVKSWHDRRGHAIISPAFLTVVSVAQLVELWIVAPAVAGSNPVAHPTPSFFMYPQMPPSTAFSYQLSAFS